MNIEDRLRTHMHSGEDLFVEGETTADDVRSSGHRRTRRNQAAGALAAGFLAVGAIAGASSLRGSGDGEPLANETFAAPNAIDDGELESSALQSSDAGISGSQLFDGVTPAFDTIVGLGDGFVGLREDNGTLFAIRSNDGLEWDATPVSGVPAELQTTFFAQDDGTFVVVFVSLDGESAFIGTSSDLVDWDLVPVVQNVPGLTMLGLAVHDGRVATGVMIWHDADEGLSAPLTPERSVITGPIGGPYLPATAEGLEGTDGADVVSFAAVNEGFALSAYEEDVSTVFASPDGLVWKPTVQTEPALQSSTVVSANGQLLSIGTTARRDVGDVHIFASDDLGESWSAVDVPSDLADTQWWSFNVRASEQNVAILLLGDAGEVVDGVFTQRQSLIVSNDDGGFVEIDLSPYANPADTVLLDAISSDEVLVQVFAAPETDDATLASSSGIVEDTPGAGDSAAPTYVRIPLN